MPDIESQDTACWWQLLKEFDVAYGQNEVLVYYRQHGQSLSRNKIAAIKKIWEAYDYENLSFLKKCYCFLFWAYNATRKRINF